VRLRYAFIVKCVQVDKNAQGEIEAIHCTYDPDTKSGTPGSESRKVKGNIHWLSAKHAQPAEVRLYDRLFSDPYPDSGDKDYKTSLNPDSKEIITAYVERSLCDAQPEQSFQFERNGYFTADRIDMKPGKVVFNRTVTLRDSWGKVAGA
jgi:glutaminyl-tRNA synthetase